MFNDLRKKLNNALERNKAIATERKVFKQELDKRVRGEQRKAYKKEAVVQARKRAKELARQKFGVKGMPMKTGPHDFGLGHDFGFESEEPQKKKKFHFDKIVRDYI